MSAVWAIYSQRLHNAGNQQALPTSLNHSGIWCATGPKLAFVSILVQAISFVFVSILDSGQSLATIASGFVGTLLFACKPR